MNLLIFMTSSWFHIIWFQKYYSNITFKNISRYLSNCKYEKVFHLIIRIRFKIYNSKSTILEIFGHLFIVWQDGWWSWWTEDYDIISCRFLLVQHLIHGENCDVTMFIFSILYRLLLFIQQFNNVLEYLNQNFVKLDFCLE